MKARVPITSAAPGRGSRPSVVCPLLLLLFLAHAPAQATQQNSQTATFQSSGQSLWNTGSESLFSYTNDWSQSWNASAGGGSFADLGFNIGDCDISCTHVDLGRFGASATISSNGKAGLLPTVSVNAGAVDVTYPVRITITYPDPGTLYPGDAFTISTSFAPAAGGSLSTTSPHARVTLDAVLDLHANASMEVEAFSKDLFNDQLFSLGFGSTTPTRILDTDDPLFQQIVDAATNFVLAMASKNVLTGTFQDTNITTSGGFVDSNLHSTGTATFFTSRLDFTNLALVLAGLPAINRSFSAAGISASVQILDGYQTLNFGLSQDFTFQTSPKVKIQLSNGQTLDLKVGDSATLTFPTVSPGAATNNLTFTPTYALDSSLTKLANKTDLHIDPSYHFTPFHTSFSGSLNAGDVLGTWDLPGFSIDPAGTIDIASYDVPVNLFNQTFALNGFSDATGTPFTLTGYVYPRPTLQQVTPAAFKPGAVTSLTAVGSKFVDAHTTSTPPLPSTTAQWNGVAQTTHYSSDMQLTFDLSDSTTEGIFPVTVFNPAPGGGTSNSKNVIIDGTPPVTTPALAGPQNANNHGWYKGNVTVNLSTNDTYSGVHEVDYQVDSGTFQHVLTGSALGPGTFATPGFTVPGEARHHVNYKSSDNVANVEAQKTQEIDIDGTPPVVTYIGNAGSYTVDQPVNLTCSSADPKLADGEPGSGVLSDTCKNIVGPAYSFNLGSNTFSASATDVAGNVGTASTTFTVRVTYDSLCALVQRFVTDSGVATALCSQLSQASAAAARGDLTTKSNILSAFISTVAAQSGQSMTTGQAAILTTLAQAL